MQRKPQTRNVPKGERIILYHDSSSTLSKNRSEVTQCIVLGSIVIDFRVGVIIQTSLLAKR